MVHLRRHRRSRQSSSSLHDTTSLDTMSIANSERSTSSSTRARARDTGFPESFCGNRNTSLPHPDADTSPNASISQDDVAVSRVLARHRRSFLTSKNKHTISSGRITAEMEQMYSDFATDSDGSPQQLASPDRPTSGGVDSIRSTSTGDHEDAAPGSPRAGRHSRAISGDSTSRGRRRSFLGKFGIHRHHE